MNTNYKLTFAVIAGVAIGAAGAGAIHAQQYQVAPAYLIAEQLEITDSTAFQKYASSVPATLAPFGGTFSFVPAVEQWPSKVISRNPLWCLLSIAWKKPAAGLIRQRIRRSCRSGIARQKLGHTLSKASSRNASTLSAISDSVIGPRETAESALGQSRHRRQGDVAVNFRSSPKADLTSAAGL